MNLTDGLDGLAIVPVMIAGASFGFVAYLACNAIFATYLQIRFVPGTGELRGALRARSSVRGSASSGSTHRPPRSSWRYRSLALGGLLGTVAVATKHEIVLAIVGGLFVMEALSVIIQVASSS